MIVMVYKGRLVILEGTRASKAVKRDQSERTTSLVESSVLLLKFSDDVAVPGRRELCLVGRVGIVVKV